MLTIELGIVYDFANLVQSHLNMCFFWRPIKISTALGPFTLLLVKYKLLHVQILANDIFSSSYKAIYFVICISFYTDDSYELQKIP